MGGVRAWSAGARGGEDCVRMSPPLVVTEAEVATALRIFSEAVAQRRRSPGGAMSARLSGPRRRADRGGIWQGGLTHRAALDPPVHAGCIVLITAAPARPWDSRRVEKNARQGRLDARRDRGPGPRRRHGRDRGLHPPHLLRGRARDHPPAPARPDARPDDPGPDLRPDDRRGRGPQAGLRWLGNPGVGGLQRGPPAHRAASPSWTARSRSRSTATSGWSPGTRRAPRTCRSSRSARTSRPTCPRPTR